ncbi:MAG: CHAT domain-containing tetratricopeptide repeat protein [Phycisphaerales bacterium]
MTVAAAIDQIDEVLGRRHSSDVDLRALSTELKALALTDLKRAVEITDRLHGLDCAEDAVAVELLSARAHVLSYAMRFDDATRLLAEAATIAERASDTAALAQVRLTSVQPLARAARLDDAQRAAEDASEAFAQSGDSIGQAKSLLNLGIVQRMRGEPQAALSTFGATLPLLTDQPMLLGALSSNRAEALLDLDRFMEAESAFLAAREAFLAAGNEHGVAIVEGNLADLFARQGRLDVALERFELARRHYERSGATGDVARLDMESAEAMAALGAHDAAILALGQSLPELRRKGLAREWQRGQFVLALCLLAGGHDAAAQRVLEDLLDQIPQDEPALRGQCLVMRATTDARHGRPHTDAAAREGLALLEGRPARLAQAHAWLADACIRGGDLETAEEHIAILAASDIVSSLAAMRAQRLHLRGRMSRARGEGRLAAGQLRAALLEAERIRGAQRADRWRIACGQHWRDSYIDAMSAALDLGDIESAVDALERIRGRSLLERAGDRLNGPADAAVRASLDALNVYYARLDAGEETTEVFARIRELEDQAERLRTRADALSEAPRSTGEPQPLDRIRLALPPSTAIVQYFVEDTGIGVFVVRRDGAHAVRSIASEAEVLQAASRLRFMIEDDNEANSSLWSSATQAFARMLLLPLASLLEGIDRLALSLPGALETVPWPALPWGGSCMVDHFELHTVPSATFAVREPMPQVRNRVVAIGVPDELAPSMQDEAHAVAAVTGGNVLVGQDGTAARVLEAIAQADVVHLATHCVYSPKHPMASRLKLIDRWITAHELVEAVRPGARVVLAGCETGRAGGINAEDRTGLVGALLARGAAEVVSTRWPLHDATAVRLFSIMHEQLALDKTTSMAEAICHTHRQAAREGMPPWRYAALQSTGGIR